jgi:hypothetical protein
MNTALKQLADAMEDETSRNPVVVSKDLERLVNMMRLLTAGAWMLRHVGEENDRLNTLLTQPPRLLDLGDQVVRGQVMP